MLTMDGGGSPTEFCLVFAVVYLINHANVLVNASRNFMSKKSHLENIEWNGCREKGFERHTRLRYSMKKNNKMKTRKREKYYSGW